MKLIKFSVTNYRSITAAHKIDLSSKTVLIGKNNEGKSNVLHALQVSMELLQEHAQAERRGLRRVYREELFSYRWKRDFPILLQDRKAVKQTIFRLEFLLTDEEIGEFKEEIGSNLNGSLPLEIRIGKDNDPDIQLKKPGKNTRTLSKKSGKIADFIARRIYFNYIPAVRTDKEAVEIISRMLSQELRVLEKDEKYLEALKVIQELQQPILDELSKNLEVPLKEFLSTIKSVKIEVPDSRRRVGIRRDFNVVIDDGTPTNLEYKGDGVKSLVALGLLKNKRVHSGASIIAIEEPESHLHPGAIHQLNKIIHSLAESNQVIITTHNPLFVDRRDIQSNIIINKGKATPAKNVGSIRDLLGIKASDNLTHANFALIVEGAEDVVSLKAILPQLSSKIGKYLNDNIMVIEPIGGAGNLSYKLSSLKTSLCETFTLLDNDEAGRSAYAKAEKDSLITIDTCTMINCAGMRNSEFEDCINVPIYKNIVLEQYGVDLSSNKFKSNNKWSDRLKLTFKDQGKPWSNSLLAQVKSTVAEAVASDPKNALNMHKRNSIDALVTAIERRLKS